MELLPTVDSVLIQKKMRLLLVISYDVMADFKIIKTFRLLINRAFLHKKVTPRNNLTIDLCYKINIDKKYHHLLDK